MAGPQEAGLPVMPPSRDVGPERRSPLSGVPGQKEYANRIAGGGISKNLSQISLNCLGNVRISPFNRFVNSGHQLTIVWMLSLLERKLTGNLVHL